VTAQPFPSECGAYTFGWAALISTLCIPCRLGAILHTRDSLEPTLGLPAMQSCITWCRNPKQHCDTRGKHSPSYTSAGAAALMLQLHSPSPLCVCALLCHARRRVPLGGPLGAGAQHHRSKGVLPRTQEGAIGGSIGGRGTAPPQQGSAAQPQQGRGAAVPQWQQQGRSATKGWGASRARMGWSRRRGGAG